MKKMGWGFGLAAAGMVFLASHALAQSGSSSGSSSDTTSTPSTGSSGSSMGTGSSSGSSYDTSTGSTSDTSSTSAANSLQGKVEKFDRAQNTLTLSGIDKRIKLDSSTKVMKDGSTATLDDIKEGDQVRASYSGSGNTVRAKSLDITSSGMGTSGSSGMGTSPGSSGSSGMGTSPGSSGSSGSGMGTSGSSGSSGSSTDTTK